MIKEKIGIIFIIGSISIWSIDRISPIFSTFIGELYCGASYMQPVDNVVGDVSCGFNMDMYFVGFLLSMLLIGIALFIASKVIRQKRR